MKKKSISRIVLRALAAFVIAIIFLPSAGQFAVAAGASPPLKGPPAVDQLLAELTPAARAKFIRTGVVLKPDGRELAEWFLRPLAEGRGPALPPVAPVKVRSGAKEPPQLAALLAHRVSLLGGYPEQDLGARIDWLRAPQDDWQWPTHLSRHYWLRPLAEAWRATKDPRYSGEVLAVLTDWVQRTPLQAPELRWGRPRSAGAGISATAEGTFKSYGDGPWTSLSAESRVGVWTELLQDIWDAPQMTNVAVALLLHSLVRDHRLIMMNHERWGTANQFTSVAEGLVHLNWWYPDFTGMAQAEQAGWERLGKVTRQQIYPDGSMAECSPNYALGSLLVMFNLAADGGRQGHAVPAEVRAAVARGARYFALISDPLGRSPRIAKGGGSLRPALQKLNVTANDPAVAFAAAGGRGQPPAPANVLFPWAGHAVFRSGWDERATWMFFEPGPRGSGHHDLAQLGVQLIANGEWLLADPGFYSYSAAGEEAKMAEYLHSSAAHNVALVDGQGQISAGIGIPRGPNAAAGDYHWTETADSVSAAGVYGYGFGDKGQISVRHTRTVVWFPKKDEFEIRDQFEGAGRHRLELRWQADPQARVAINAATAQFSMPRAALEIAPTGKLPLKLKVIRGEQNPLGGWFSAGYGKLEPAPTLCVSGEAGLPQQIVTRLKIQRLK